MSRFSAWLRVPCSTLNTDGTRTRCPENQLKRSSGENEGPRNQCKDSPVNFSRALEAKSSWCGRKPQWQRSMDRVTFWLVGCDAVVFFWHCFLIKDPPRSIRTSNNSHLFAKTLRFGRLPRDVNVPRLMCICLGCSKMPKPFGRFRFGPGRFGYAWGRRQRTLLKPWRSWRCTWKVDMDGRWKRGMSLTWT